MFVVYILQDNEGNLYKGMTSDIERRFREHVSGKTKTTRSMVGLRVIYTEEYETSLDARLREKYLKSAAGRRFLKQKNIGTRSSAG